MKKGTITGFIIFIILAGGLFMLLTNAHVQAFPGTAYEKTFLKDFENGTIEAKEKSVSLLAVSRGDAELNVIGYLIATLVIVGFPLLVAYPIGRRMNRKAAHRAMAKQQSTNV